jgi:hypothetical protein
MFGYNVKQIAQGWAKKMLRQGEHLYNKRIVICRQCPLYNDNPTLLKEVCDAHRCVDPITLKVSYDDNAVCGCGCELSAALRLENKKCVLKKW